MDRDLDDQARQWRAQHPIRHRLARRCGERRQDAKAEASAGGFDVDLAGAFRNIGRTRIADDILNTMRAADYAVRETDPFETKPAFSLSAREVSPHVNRIRLLWHRMREPILARFPKPPGRPNDARPYLKQVEEIYVTDAYHSLSIEGYRVSPALIERVRSGNWNPDGNDQDREHRDALAARGYWQTVTAHRRTGGGQTDERGYRPSCCRSCLLRSRDATAQRRKVSAAMKRLS
ncbi:MAG TPA: hypothetical protein VF226_15940 [Hyphomicrobiaceae bacterium]